MLVLNQAQVRQCITMPEAIEAVAEAFVAYSTGQVVVPERSTIEVRQTSDYTLFMPGFVPELGSLGLKVVSVFPDNVQRQLPAVPAVVLLFDPTTGIPAALLDGTYLTVLRTGAAAGVATQHLARREATTLAIIGTGGLAASQLEAICCVRFISQVWVYNRTRSKAEAFVAQMGQDARYRGIRFGVCVNPEEAVKKADIVVACTSSQTPVVHHSWLKPGTHVNGMGSFHLGMQEVNEELVIQAECRVVDSITAATTAGDLAVPLCKGHVTTEDLVEIGHIVSLASPGRQSDTGMTYFKSVGLAVQDLTVAAHVVNIARERGLGTRIDIE